MRIVLVAWVGHKAGIKCSIRSSSISTVPYEKFNNLLPTFSRCAAINYYTLYSALEMGIYYCVTVPIDYYYFSDVQQTCEFTAASQCYKNEKLLLSTSL